MNINGYVFPGSVITDHTGYLRGHGTKPHSENSNILCSTVSGFTEQINRLISVHPINSRYRAEVGDVVVGRITDVGDQKWKVDINDRRDSILQLSAIILPGGMQRRRTVEDQLQMREFYSENDLISAEIQKTSENSIHLHTRSIKYGKLSNGSFISVPSTLVKRCKSHFVQLDFGVSIILGNNGYCWVSAPNINNSDEAHKAIALVINILHILSSNFYMIHSDSIMLVYHNSIRLKLSPDQLLNPSQFNSLLQGNF